MNLFCNKHGITDFYIKKSGRRTCKKCDYNSCRKYLKDIKLKAIGYKGGCCSYCGYDICLWALDFHHRDPSQKSFNILENKPGLKKVRNWEKLKIELDKCDLLCKNCRYELHEEEKIEIEKLKVKHYKYYQIHRKNINWINNALESGTKTPEMILKEIEQGKYRL